MDNTDNNTLKLSYRFVSYLEKHRIYELFQELSAMLLIKKPEDHVLFLKQSVQHASRRLDAPRVIIIAPPGCDKLQFAGTLREKLRLPLIMLNDIADYEEPITSMKLSSILDNLRTTLINYMSFNCDGWILIDFPRNEEEARHLLRTGIIPSHVIEIVSHDVDPQLGKDFCPCSSKMNYYKEIKGIRRVFSKYIKTISMDNKSIGDVFDGYLNLFNQRHYLRTPTTLRILLLNFVSEEEGKRLGLKLAQDFSVTYINFSQVMEQVSLQENDLGDKLREIRMNDDLNDSASEIKAKVFEHFLLQSDGLKRGWILCGFVSNVNDFKHLDLMDYPPNRVVIIVHEETKHSARSSSCTCNSCLTDTKSDSTTEQISCNCEEENWDQIIEYAGKAAYIVPHHDDFNVIKEKIQSCLMLPLPCVPPRIPRPAPGIKLEDIEFDPDGEPSTKILDCIRRPEPMLTLI